MSYEFYVNMVKRSDGAPYPDLNKTDERIYFTPEDAQAAIDKDPLKGTFIGRHVMKLVAELPKDMDKGYQELAEQNAVYAQRIMDLEAAVERLDAGWQGANSTILDRDLAIVGLKADIATLEAQVISGFYEERVPTFQQGIPTHELQEVVTAEEVTGLVAKIESILKQMGGYVIEVTELRAKLEKAREALEGVARLYAHKRKGVLGMSWLDNVREALALLQSSNVIASIKAEAWRDAGRYLGYEPQRSQLNRMADKLLQEKKG